MGTRGTLGSGTCAENDGLNQHAQVTRRHQLQVSPEIPQVRPNPFMMLCPAKTDKWLGIRHSKPVTGIFLPPRNARQDTRPKLAGTKAPDAREPEALIVNKSADETPRGWYCACCSTSETTHAHVHVPLCPIFPMSKSKSLSGFPLHGGQGHARPASEKPEPCPHSVTTDFADRKALRTRGQHPWSSCHHCSGCQNRSVKMLR